MRIIKRGRPKKEVWRGTCQHCNSVLEADRSELQIRYDPRDQTEVGGTTCVICKNTVHFYSIKE